METKEGVIQFIKPDRKSFTIENTWFNSFKPISDSIQVGNEVKVVYSIKGDFKNVKSIDQIKNETKELPREKVIIAHDFNKVNLVKSNQKILPNQTENTVIMCAKDIIVAEINSGDYNYTPEELTSKIQKLTNDFKLAYNNL